jgi:hypothetical protein
MASYVDLYNLGANSELRNRVTVACLIAAQSVMVELVTTTNHANRLLWAKDVFSDPHAMGQKMLMAALAANATLAVAQITGASDAALLATVQGAINLFATGT